MRVQKRFWICAALLMLGTLLAASASQAQDDIILTLGIPEWMNDTFQDELFEQFEADNPGVKVVVEQMPQSYVSSAAYDADGFRESAAAYVSTGDVLYVENWTLTQELTRGGYILDLAPLIQADMSLNSEDFYPVAWEAYQWDGGVWALPVSVSVQFLIYDPAAFDAAGLAYPTPDWTLNEFATAVRALTVRDDDGEITLPGFSGDYSALARAWLGRGFYDDSVSPELVVLTEPEMLEIAQVLSELNAELTYDWQNVDWQRIPLRIEGVWALESWDPNMPEMAASLLPGGVASTSVTAFALSSGTVYPEQAYALANYLTNNVDVAARLWGDRPARRSLIESREENENFFRDISDENEALVEEALEVALSPADMRYSSYFSSALYYSPDSEMPEGATAPDPDVVVRLATNEAEANTLMQELSSEGAELALSVPTPVPTPILSSSEVSLRFNLQASVSPLPNSDEWEAAVAEFVEADPEVGQLVFEPGFGSGPDMWETYDCAYVSFSYLAGVTQVPTDIIALDPLISADPNFDQNDFVGDSLQSVQFEGVTYGYPITMQPLVMWLNLADFEEAGVPLPETTWTFEQFVDTLRMLQTDPDEPVYRPSNARTAWLMLIAAAGGLPVDFNASVEDIDFTNPANIDAIRQVLDLGREGLIDYSALGGFGFGGGGGFGGTIYDERLSDFSYRFEYPGDEEYRAVLFPSGTQYTPMANNVGAAYISANTPNPEACYRWISFMAQRPELFHGMPARRSLLDNAEMLAVQGEEMADTYTQIDAVMSDPNLVMIMDYIPSSHGMGGWMSLNWLAGAFDAYVLEDTDIETALADAQATFDAYMECDAAIERVENPFETLGEQAAQEYWAQFEDCAIAADPDTAQIFNRDE